MKQKQIESWVRLHRALLVITGLCVTTATLYADLFGFDDGLLAEILGQDTITAEKDTVTAEQTLQGVQLATAMATHLHDKQWMKTFAADAGQLYLDDHNGVNVNMGRILNGDYQYGAQPAVQAWQETTTDPGDSSFMASDTPGKSGRLARLASIKFSDAAAGNCLQVLGQYRSNASALETNTQKEVSEADEQAVATAGEQ